MHLVSPEFRSCGLRGLLLGVIVTVGGVAELGGQVPLGIIEGRLTEVEGGRVTVELADGRKVGCAVDHRTYVDRERRRIGLTELKTGDFLELVTERHGPGQPCFARMIHLATGALRFGGRHKVGQVTRATETISPRGNVQMGGVVRQLQPERMELRTKQGESHWLRLRPDTAYVQDGVRVGREDLGLNSRVSVRCGYAMDGELEVYQVAWGGILPRPAVP